MGYFKQKAIKNGLFINKEEYSMLQLEQKEKSTHVYPRIGKLYDITTNQGNIHRKVMFLGYSNGVAKPKYLFKREDGNTLSINPSYEVEMEEIN